MRLDLTDNANQGLNSCKYEELCGPADNVVTVGKEADNKTSITRPAVVATDSESRFLTNHRVTSLEQRSMATNILPLACP